MTPAVDTAKKGIDGGGPVTEAEIGLPTHLHVTNAIGSSLKIDGIVESPEGLSPSGAPRTVHDPLEYPMDEPFEFAARPANDIEIDPFEGWTQLHPVEFAVVADPAADDGVDAAVGGSGSAADDDCEPQRKVDVAVEWAREAIR